MNGLQGLPTLCRGALLALVTLTWMAAGSDAHAAKDKAMCAGLTGALHGLCTAGAALECGSDTKNQKQCDKLADKFEGIAGSPPPWEEPVDPPPPGEGVQMQFDLDALDLETGEKCDGVSEGPCIADDTLLPIDPYDFWVSFNDGPPATVVLIPANRCLDESTRPAVARLEDTPFASVMAATGLPFVEDWSEVPFGATDTLVYRNCGATQYFKIGIIDLDENSVTLDIAAIPL